jgi:crotonobetainyl-CoA:carnitine CoA-transferase CaiB-like acyl-CoA transferase
VPVAAERAGGGPLAHLRVVDLTDLRGALAGRILADLGADVIKVESPAGDPGRLRSPFAGNVAGPDRSLAFLFRNANKRGAVIDLGEPSDRERFHELCARADVLLENLDLSEAQRHGLMPGEIRARHPHLIHVAIADFGRSGPRAGWRLEPLCAFAASGALYASGFPDRPPCWLPGYLAHDCAAIVAVVGALAALLDRARHGAGQTVEVSVQDAALASLDPWGILLADYARVYPVLPTSLPRDADGPALVLPTADGYVRVLAVTPRQWGAFVALLAGRNAAATGEREEERSHHLPARGTWGIIGSGLSALADQGLHVAGLLMRTLAHLPLRDGALSALRVILGLMRRLGTEALHTRPRAEVLAHARRLGLPMVPVHTPEEFVSAEQTRVRGYFRRTGFPACGDAPFAPFPCNLSRTPATLRRPAPVLGEDDHLGFPPRTEQAGEGVAGGPVLAGVRVVSLGVGAVVPELCRTLAELGAEVIKVESRAHPDFLRRLTLEPDAPNRSFTFNDENRGQQSVCLDLGTSHGRELALALCAAADVVAENRQGGMVERWGLDYARVRQVRPDVIYVSSQGYGQGGPLGSAPAFGPLNAAFAGASFLWNHPDAPYPAGSSLEHPDHLAGKLAAVAVLAALEHRRRTGEGQRIEMAQTEALAYLSGEVYLEAECTGRLAVPRGNVVDYACPHGVYPTAGEDRWCAIAVVGEDAWTRFRACLGWTDDPRLATLEGRLAARAELDRRVGEWTRVRSAEEAATTLQDAGVSAMVVQGADDHRADPHLAARGALVTLDDPEIGPVRHVANPLRLSRTPLVVANPAPRLGAHTRAVLQRVFGLGTSQIDELTGEGPSR